MSAPTPWFGAAFSVLAALGAGLGLAGPATAQEQDWPQPIHDSPIISFVLIDQLEFRENNNRRDGFEWDAQGWIGGDYNRFWFKTEGADSTAGNGDFEVQALYSRLITPFWDFQAGLRYDRTFGDGPDRSRGHAVIGVQGLAPYRWEVEPALFVSEDGDVSARLTASYDLLLTQRLILQPRIETNLAFSEVPEFDVGSGFNDIQMELRLRYEIRREFAPYIGLAWARLLGDSAGLARAAGEKGATLAVVVGVRAWF